jgi:cytoskeletal protein CcmA (bactofilin family)
MARKAIESLMLSMMLLLSGCIGGDNTATDDDTDIDDTPIDTSNPDLYEGDDAGECTDGADNDQDGLFDCNDPNCAGSPDCATPGDNNTQPDDNNTQPQGWEVVNLTDEMILAGDLNAAECGIIFIISEWDRGLFLGFENELLNAINSTEPPAVNVWFATIQDMQGNLLLPSLYDWREGLSQISGGNLLIIDSDEELLIDKEITGFYDLGAICQPSQRSAILQLFETISPSASNTTAPVVSEVNIMTMDSTIVLANSTLTCDYTFYDADNGSDRSWISWFINGQKVLGPEHPGFQVSESMDTQLQLSGSGLLYSGDVIMCEITADDGQMSGNTVFANITVQNGPPSVSNVIISPSSATINDALTCSYDFSDIDSDGDNSSIYWYVDTVQIGNGSTISLSYDSGDVVECVVTANDGIVDGNTVISQITIQNSAPTVSGVSISPSTAYATTALACTYSFSDADNDGNQSIIYWYANNVQIGSGSTISSGYVGGDSVECRVTPNDGIVDGSTVISQITIQNSAPTVSDISISPSNAYATTALTCTYSFSDADNDADQSAIYWYVNDVHQVGTGSSISSGYVAGDDVDCRVISNDGIVDGNTLTSQRITIQNSAPTVSGVSISPFTADVTTTITCTYSFSDADNDVDQSIIYWYADTVQIGTGSSISSGYSAFDGVECVVTANDGIVDGNTATSPTIIIENSAPTVSGVSISPSNANATTALTCTYSFSDADNDVVQSTIEWYANSVLIGTVSTISSGYVGGDSVDCRVTPFDGIVNGSTVTSSSITIQNSAPTVSGVSISPSNADVTTTLTCTYSFSDADNDADQSIINWYVNSVQVGTGSSISSGYVGGDDVDCRVISNDGIVDGNTATSQITIQNSAPTVSGVSISPSNADVTTTLTCTYSFSDPDNDADQSTINWYVNSVQVGTGSSISSGYAGGDSVECRVIANDGIVNGNTVTSSSITIQNSAPTVSGVGISPNGATSSDMLTCTYSFSDPDNDADQSTIEWYVNGAYAGSGSTLSLGYSSGDTVECRVTANDGSTNGNVASDTITIQ